MGGGVKTDMSGMCLTLHTPARNPDGSHVSKIINSCL